MKVFVKGIGEVTLNQREFLAKGGEGSIYVQNNTAYKIYDDYKKMMPEAKFIELSVLNHPSIIKPDHILLNPKNNPIGYTMKFVKDAHELCKLFTKAFKQRNGVTNETIVALTKRFHEIISFIHSKNILVVDLNELNFLTNFHEIYAIDVNSYQTSHYPATAIMESVRDRHAKKFDENTDWFSWGVVVFQMLIGIHPYRGNHPDFDSLDLDKRLDARMKKNVSVFHKDATFPKICQPFDIIPNALRHWLEAIFEKGLRAAPPNDYDELVAVSTKIKEITGSNLFEIEKLTTYIGTVLDHYFCGSTRIVRTTKDIYINDKPVNYSNDVKIGFTPKYEHPIAAHKEKNSVKFFDLHTKQNLTFNTYADDVFSIDNRLYLKNGINILELIYIEQPNSVIAALKSVGTVLDFPEATKIYENVIIQSLLGRYVGSFFPESGKCYQIQFPELDGYKIIDAKFQNKVLGVIAVKSGVYDRFIFVIEDGFKTYKSRKTENISTVSLNFTCTDAGICVIISEKVEALNIKSPSLVKILDDPNLDVDFRLTHEGNRVMFFKDDELFSLKMR